jgi:kynurenine formamidase
MGNENTRLVDLSHVITAGMTTYPGLPGPTIAPHLTREASRERYAPGTEFAIDSITMVGNTGTYLDSPFHRYADGVDLAGLALEVMADLPGVLVRTTGGGARAVDVDALATVDVAGRAVLLHTGGDIGWGTPDYARDAPYLTEAGARWLADHEARLVGIDSVNIDDTAGGERPAHSILLAAGIPVVEHLTNLDLLPPNGFRFTAVPPRVARFGTFPVRAFAAVPDAAGLALRPGTRGVRSFSPGGGRSCPASAGRPRRQLPPRAALSASRCGAHPGRWWCRCWRARR